MPDAPAQPSGPPQAEQFNTTEEWVRAEVNYGTEQKMRERDQQMQQVRFQMDLMSREAAV